MNTPTPRTDAASALTSQHRHDDLFGDPEFGWVTAGFARTLERELATEREKVRELHALLVYADQILDDIDTCSDAHKPMYSTYSQNVFKLCIKGRDARRSAIDAAMQEGSK